MSGHSQETLEVGPQVLANGLREKGYEVGDSVPPALGSPAYGFVRFLYTIKLGSRSGETLEMGFIAPNDFPINPPAGIYVLSDVRPISSESTLPHGGVSDASSLLGPGWRYWSRTHDAWAASTRDAAAWMKHVDRLFADL
jgi:hypothetical protein